jgi:hypothetical protein
MGAEPASAIVDCRLVAGERGNQKSKNGKTATM